MMCIHSNENPALSGFSHINRKHQGMKISIGSLSKSREKNILDRAKESNKNDVKKQLPKHQKGEFVWCRNGHVLGTGLTHPRYWPF
jgi:hypothetical protein